MASNKGIVAFFKSVLAEIRKTTWPTPEEVKKTVLAVAFVCFIYVVLSGTSDFIINVCAKYFSMFIKNVFKLG